MKPSASKKTATTTEKALPPATASGLGVGERVPTFSADDQNDASVGSANLRGTYVLYFYPRDNTPGCTVEACEFRDELKQFSAAKVRVVGVSPDSISSHQKFVAKFKLNFSLLADPDHAVADAFGTWVLKKNYGKEYMGIERSTFLIDGAGVVHAVWRKVRVKGHVAEVLAAAQAL
ncbi:MAG: thioredoxin-dependent thiol peroxidase [Polyangiaceae bacterium]|nr:thioredoxin-dependent thiol peroxidase [Polyangiaceae bacterium]